MIRAIAGEPLVAIGRFNHAHLRVGPRETKSLGIGERRLGPEAGLDDLFMRGNDHRPRYRGLADWSEILGSAGCPCDLEEASQCDNTGERRAEEHGAPSE
jgi:hypothetical protein